jgi:hypothetical protein
MTKPMVRIHNTETDEIIDREMNASELKVFEAEKKIIAGYKAEADAKAVEKQAILDRIGLTADEAKLLLG